MRANADVIAAADVGSSTVRVVLAERDGGVPRVIATGMHDSAGLRNGEVVDIERTAQALANALEDAVSTAARRVDSIAVGVSARHVKALRGAGTATTRRGIISHEDVDAALDDARARAGLSADHVWLHTFVREFSVDGRDGVMRPVGMQGRTVEARATLVSARRSAADALDRCASRAGRSVSTVQLDTYAASRAVLTAEERERGCVLVDIGGRNTDIAVWVDGALVHAAVIEMGGEQLTSDIGGALRMPRDGAERLKRAHGVALASRAPQGEQVPVQGVTGQTGRLVQRRLLAQILESRMDDILHSVSDEVHASGCAERLDAGYVLVGGTSILPATLEFAERVFEAPVRLGVPGEGLGGMVELIRDPRFATAAGLLLAGADVLGSALPGVAPGQGGDGLRERLARLFHRLF